MRDDQSNDPALDDVLNAATWPTAGTERIERLQQGLNRLRRRQRRRATGAMAFVTLLMMAVTVGIRWWRAAPDVDVAETIAVDTPIGERKPQQPGSEVDVRPETNIAPAREANTYERTVLLLHGSRKAARRASKNDEKAVDPYEEAIASLVADPEQDVAALAGSLRERDENYEQRLVELVTVKRGEPRLAAVRLLAAVATRRSRGILLEAFNSVPPVAEVAAAVARLSTEAELTRLARSAANPARARLWMTALLERDSPEAARAFLTLFDEPHRADLALDVCEQATPRTVEAWFAELSGPRVALRMAAARTLAAQNDPDVSARLVKLTEHAAVRREALAGLVLSRDEVAEAFIQSARNDVWLAASLQNVVMKLRRQGALN